MKMKTEECGVDLKICIPADPCCTTFMEVLLGALQG